MTSDQDLRLMLIAVHQLIMGQSQQIISKQLGVSASKVSRLIKSSKNFIELKYNIPGNDEIEMKLISKYRLADAVIAETGSADQATKVIGYVAARYFITHVKNEQRISISCGETLLEMLKALPTRSQFKLNIGQLSVEGDPEAIHQAPSTLVGILRAKCSTASNVCGIQLPPPSMTTDFPNFRNKFTNTPLIKQLRKDARNSDYVFIGIGTPLPPKDRAHAFYQLIERVYKRGDYIKQIHDNSIVGEINNQLYDAKGIDRTDVVEKLRDQFINILTLKDIKEMASERKKHKVVAIATGISKVEAIRAALIAGLANVIITGRDVAEALLR